MAVRIRAFDCTLVANHVHSRKQVLGSIASNPKIVRKGFAALRQLLRIVPSKEHHSRYITLFFQGTYGVIGFYELIRVSFADLKHFLR